MKVLMLSTDKKILEPGSEVQKRMKDYGTIFEELYIVLYTKQPTTNNQQLTTNVWAYPTNSRFKLFYLWDAYKIGKKIVGNWKLEIRNSVITAQDPFEVGLVGWLLKLFFKVPLQLQVHADIFSPYFWQESWKNKLRVLLAKFLISKADGIRVVSERIKQSLKSHVKCQMSNVSILPIFVDVQKIQSAKVKFDLRQKYQEYDFIILMASRLTREKNIGMAIEAMAEICKAQSTKHKILLLIVGSGSEEKKLRLAISDLRLADNIIIEPYTDDLISYYKTADLFLLTSNYEGYGRTVVEAMVTGLPVIMTDVGIAGEFLIDDLDGKVVPVGDAKALAKTISKLMENSAKREEFKKNNLKLLEKWPTKQEYLGKYKSLIML